MLLQYYPILIKYLLGRNLWQQLQLSCLLKIKKSKKKKKKAQFGETLRLELGSHHLKHKKGKLNPDCGCGTGRRLSRVVIWCLGTPLFHGTKVHRLCMSPRNLNFCCSIFTVFSQFLMVCSFIDLFLRDPFIMFNFRGSVLMFPVVTVFINRNIQAFLVSHLAHGVKILLGN